MQVDEHLYACTGFSYDAEWVSALPSAKYNLPLSDSLYLNAGFRNKIRGQLAEVPLKGHSYRYSCLNFMLLQEMVEELARMPMDVYLDSVFYKPMGLMHTAYNPLRHFPKAQIIGKKPSSTATMPLADLWKKPKTNLGLCPTLMGTPI